MGLFRRASTPPEKAVERPAALWRPDQYRGQASIAVRATQLADRHAPTAAGRREILAEWVRFLSTAETSIVELEFVSRVPQELLDAAAGQSSLRSLSIKWGPYRDLSGLGRLSRLETLALGGAVNVETLAPLGDLTVLSALTVSEAYRVDDLSVFDKLGTLQSLTFGNAYPGSDRTVVLPDVRWLRALAGLKRVELPGTRILDGDLSPLLDLPGLEVLKLPLRRAYRKQVFAYASRSSAFAVVAADYESYDAYVASRRARN